MCEEIIITETKYKCSDCGIISKNKSYILNKHKQYCGRLVIRKRNNYENLPNINHNLKNNKQDKKQDKQQDEIDEIEEYTQYFNFKDYSNTFKSRI